MVKGVVLVLGFCSFLVAQAEEPKLAGQVKLKVGICQEKPDLKVVCEFSSPDDQDPKAFLEVLGDDGKAEYVEFALNSYTKVWVKVGTNSSPESYFVTLGFYGFDENSDNSIFENGESIIEVEKKENLQTAQIFSPHFELIGLLIQLKATVKFNQN